MDDGAFSVKDMPYFAGIGSNDGMLHLHGTEDYQHLALFHCIAIVCPNLDNGTSHRCREHFLSMGDITAFRGSVYVRGLTPRQLIKTPVEYDIYPFFEALYIGSRLACFPPEENKAIMRKCAGEDFCCLRINLNTPFTIPCFSYSNGMLYARPCVIDAIGFPNHTPWTQGIPDVTRYEMRVLDIAVVRSICYTCAGNVIQCRRDQRLIW